jgi:hypothetical protein
MKYVAHWERVPLAKLLKFVIFAGKFGRLFFPEDLFSLSSSDGNFRLALKIIKNVDKYREAARLEINVLKTIKEKDPDGVK